MSRKKIIAGNWKMNLSLEDVDLLVNEIANKAAKNDAIKILIPSFPYLNKVGKLISNRSDFFLGAQNCSSFISGAYTGEVSAQMLESVSCKYVLVGHSERRSYFNEQPNELIDKLKNALACQLFPIFCIGETLNDRNAQNHLKVIEKQIKDVMSSFKKEEVKSIILAYEPVWAIGTGETASPEQAQEMHAFIREIIAKLFDKSASESMPILYGGSCNSSNAKALFACKDIDGGLIGGASLKANEFCAIISEA